MKFKILFMMLVGISLSMVLEFKYDYAEFKTASFPSISFGVEKAYARGRSVARRTSRRVTRRTVSRVASRTSIAGCGLYNSYYNCGGVYYQPIVQNGTTVYVVINP